jgi:hypothetical protein
MRSLIPVVLGAAAGYLVIVAVSYAIHRPLSTRFRGLFALVVALAVVVETVATQPPGNPLRAIRPGDMTLVSRVLARLPAPVGSHRSATCPAPHAIPVPRSTWACFAQQHSIVPSHRQITALVRGLTLTLERGSITDCGLSPAPRSAAQPLRAASCYAKARAGNVALLVIVTSVLAVHGARAVGGATQALSCPSCSAAHRPNLHPGGTQIFVQAYGIKR